MFKRSVNKWHVASWLFKDIAWCLKLATLATIMVIPTLLLTAYILIAQKEERDQNLILSSWVLMNVFWMMHELHDWSKYLIFVFMILGIVFSFLSMKSCLSGKCKKAKNKNG